MGRVWREELAPHFPPSAQCVATSHHVCVKLNSFPFRVTWLFKCRDCFWHFKYLKLYMVSREIPKALKVLPAETSPDY